MITGMGVVSAFGDGCGALWQAMQAGVTAIRPVVRFETRGLSSHRAALLPAGDAPVIGPTEVGPAQEHAVTWAVRACTEALGAAGDPPRDRIALVLGSNLEDAPLPLHRLAARVGDALGVGGPRVVVSVACASSTAAVAVARDLMDRGDVACALVGGVDVITPGVFAGFSVLGALAPERSRPFSEPVGMSLGEGAAFVVLESASSASQRGVPIVAGLLGVGLAADAHHPTQPAPDGGGVARAVRHALDDAGLDATVVDYVNAHGTGTDANDAAEVRGIVAGLQRGDVPISSAKGLLGHAQGAAGMLELVVALLARQHGTIPPTWGFDGPRPGAPADPVVGSAPRQHAVETLLSTSSAFGGANASVLVGPPVPRASPQASRVAVRATAAVGPHGDDLARLRAQEWPLTGELAAGQAWRLAPRVDPRRSDPATALLIAAVGRVLREAALRTSGPAGLRIGLVVGQRAVSQHANRQYHRSIERGGVAAAHGGSFARALLVAPAGACATHFGVRGPINVVDAGRASGLLALAHGVALMQRHADLDAVVVAAADEVGDWPGAAAALLDRSAADLAVESLFVGGAEHAVDRVCAWAGAGVPVVDAATVVGNAACSGLVAIALDAAAGPGPRVITAVEPGSAAVAVRLVGADDVIVGR